MLRRFFDEGVILSGSPYSVYDEDAPHVDPAVFELGVPILGICYGLQVRIKYHLPIMIILNSGSVGDGLESEGQSCEMRSPRIWLRAVTSHQVGLRLPGCLA